MISNRGEGLQRRGGADATCAATPPRGGGEETGRGGRRRRRGRRSAAIWPAKEARSIARAPRKDRPLWTGPEWSVTHGREGARACDLVVDKGEERKARATEEARLVAAWSGGDGRNEAAAPASR